MRWGKFQVKPREQTLKRMEKTKLFWGMAGVSQYLRSTCLALQLTARLHNLCAKLNTEAGKLPALVRIAKVSWAWRLVALRLHFLNYID